MVFQHLVLEGHELRRKVHVVGVGVVEALDLGPEGGDLVAAVGLDVLEGGQLVHQPAVLELIKRVRGAFEDKDIWVFTGFTLEELREDSCRAKAEQTEEILSLIDVLVDGRYVDALRDLTLKFRGSQNQRLIDTKKTLSEGRVVQL